MSPEKILRLSDAYLEKMEHPMLELEVKVININLPSGHRLLDKCRPMYEYSWFIQQIKSYRWDGLNRDDAITQAVKDCVEEGILVEFMKIPEDIRKSIEDERDGEILKKWCMAAPGVKSFEEFRENMQTTDK